MPRPAWYKRKLIIDFKAQLLLLIFSVALGEVLAVLQFIMAEITRSAQATPDRKMVLNLILVGILIGALWLGLEISNRIFGPIYRLRVSMEAIASGKPVDDIAFRKGDSFFELAGAYNKVLERLRIAEGTQKPPLAAGPREPSL